MGSFVFPSIHQPLAMGHEVVKVTNTYFTFRSLQVRAILWTLSCQHSQQLGNRCTGLLKGGAPLSLMLKWANTFPSQLSYYSLQPKSDYIKYPGTIWPPQNTVRLRPSLVWLLHPLVHWTIALANLVAPTDFITNPFHPFPLEVFFPSQTDTKPNSVFHELL